ncbi:hypothetical protein O0I10_009912 [Lichtheimia ornata]|uniref:Afadin and alpha-actinin-binding-domain-containing protein n=1 Tax=Lichtheimia ornata TaxID=688661 RepID=A0AAD7XVM7_9FUNG|nr:uncharacterized protein O0I10_009912 [Lichtheimia ornata]KAJ8654471.1 hypothetical protein O0I10_009912 [Lichtheimia ornata]
MDIIDDHSFSLGSLEPPLSPALENEPTGLTTTTTNKNELCSPSNLASTANYVNILLTAHNYPAPLIFDSNNDQDTCNIVNCLYTLLKDKQRDDHHRAELERRVSELEQGQQELESKLEKSRQDLDQSRRECIQLKAKVDSANKKVKAEADKRRAITTELTQAKHNMQYIKAQYAHDTRKHEQEQAKTRERLYKLMDEKQKANVPSMVINDPFPGSASYSKDSEEVSEERAMYTDLLRKSSDREKSALREADTFRKIVVDLYSTVSDLLSRQIRNYNDTFPSTKNDKGERDYPLLQLPLEIAGSTAIDRVHDLLARLKEEWNRQIDMRKVYSEEDMAEKDEMISRLEESNDELVETLKTCLEACDRKVQMYMRFTDGAFFDNTPPNANVELSDSESSVYEDATSENKLRQLLSRAKAEQRKVTEAAIKLGDDRKKLEAERWAFDEMKRTSLMQDLLSGDDQDLPRNRRHSQISNNNNNPRKRHRIANNDPLSPLHPNLPTTSPSSYRV